MHRRYRRPGLSRIIEELLDENSRRRRPMRATAQTRRERLSRLVQQITAPTDLSDTWGAPEDRRSALRQPAPERPFSAVPEGRDPITIYLENVSRSGICFRTETALACGETLTVSAPEPYQLEPKAVRVVRARMLNPSLPERGFEYGAEYLEQDAQSHVWFLRARIKR